MRKQEVIQLVSYVGVSVLAVGAALLISLNFIGRSRAQAPQEAPPVAPETVEPPPVQPIDPTQATSNAQSSGIAELEGFLEPFIYDMVNRRDPFMPYAEFQPADEGPARALTPAQRFSLEELRLVGVMWDIKEPKAMFMDPEAEVLVLGRDESIGNRNGYIAAIREGEVVVVEAIRKRGDIIYRTRVLRIER
ncbi:MAG: pilus assembly protein PilP [Pseudobdellovibrionaceae bacterium]